MAELSSQAPDFKENKKPPQIPAEREPAGTVPSFITPEEQVEVMREIDTLALESRKVLSENSFSYKPRQRGWVFPLLINGLGIIIVAAGLLVLLFAYNTHEKQIITTAALGLGVQDRYLNAFKKEAEEKIAGKDKEISKIKNDLTSLEVEKKALALKNDTEIRKMEAVLANKNEEELVRERSRLTAAGNGGEAVTARVDELSDNLRKRREAELAVFKRQKSRELNEQAARYEEMIAEKNKALSEIALQDRSPVKASELPGARAAAGQLEQLRLDYEREQLVIGQILSSYERFRNDFADRRYDRAVSTLSGLENYLNEPAVAALSAVRERRSSDLFIIGALQRLVAYQVNANGADPAPAAVAEVAKPTEKEDPALTAARKEIKRLQDELERQKNPAVKLPAIDRKPSAERVKLAAIIAEFTNYKKKNAAVAALPGEKLRKLLEAKLTVRELLSSAPVRKQYPDLYKNLEEYFDVFQREYLLEGETVALTGMINVLAGINKSGDKKAMTALWSDNPSQAQRDLLSRYFDALLQVLK